MSEEDKKYDLSGRRRDELRQKGEMPRSQDINTVIVLGVGFLLMIFGGGMVVESLRHLMAKTFRELGQGNLNFTPETIRNIFTSNLWLWMGIFLVALAAAVFISQVAQVGLNFIDDALTLRFNALNPLEGIKRIFSLNRLVQIGQSIVKLSVVALFTYQAINEIKASPVFLRPVSLDELGKTYLDVAWALGWRVILVLGIMAAADYGYQFWKFNQDHKMTLQEVRDEHRSTEASPEIIKKRKQKARQLSLRRMMENLQDATVVITNPTHYAIALRYKKGENEAPIIVAKAMRLSALRIKERAYDLRIPVRENKPLAQGLYKYGTVDKPIPPIFYQGVAVILAALYKQGFQAVENKPIPSQESPLDDDII